MNNVGRNRFDLGVMDSLAAGSSPLHRLDPRAKLITTLVFIVVVVSFDKYALSALMPFFIYPIVLISIGGLPAGYLLKKLLLVAPLAALVGIFNPLIDRQILFYIGSTGISGGWVSFLSIMTRFVLTVTAALVLVALTGFNAVCNSLLKFGVPKPFVVQLLFFYRYMFVLNDETEKVIRAGSFRAGNCRVIGVQTFIPLAGNLLLRTLDRAERIYCAMRCRGFDGSIGLIRPMKAGFKEVVFVAGWSLVFIFLRCFNLSLKAGMLVTGIGR